MLDSIVVSQHSHQPKRASQRLKTMLEVNDLGHLDLGQSPSALQATALAADYLASVHRHDDIAIRDVEIQETSEGMVLDQTTLRNLEITQTLAGEYEGSLLWAMNKCRTAMGRRCLKSWLLRPLSNVDAMQARHASVGALMRSSKRLDLLRESLKGMLDLERLATQLKYNRSNARDLLATANAIERLPAIQRLCGETEDGLLMHLVEQLHLLTDVAEDIHRTLVDEVPLGLREGGLIRTGIDEELDRYRSASNQGHGWFSNLETTLRNELSIPSLKVRMNRQIGWFIEVTATHEDKVPEAWTRKQQMTNGNRYVTDELREQDDLLLTAESKSKSIEYALFCSLRDRVRQHANQLAQIASKVAAIDVLQCFASTARQRSWVKPVLTDGRKMVLSQARHPVLEVQQGFVPNDVVMDDKRRFLLITGPNMGGKSTYLRTVALVSILAQAGSFVPAEKARLGLIDRIFTRVGASDDLRRGRSTFMMEMIEVAHILRRATRRNLFSYWMKSEEEPRPLMAYRLHGLLQRMSAIESVHEVSLQHIIINWSALNPKWMDLRMCMFKLLKAMEPCAFCTPLQMDPVTNPMGFRLQHSQGYLVMSLNELLICSLSLRSKPKARGLVEMAHQVPENMVSPLSLATLPLLLCSPMNQRLHR